MVVGSNMTRVGWCVLLASVAFAAAFSEPNAYQPELVNPKGRPVKKYHGQIAENAVTVNLSPPLRAVDKDDGNLAGSICGFDIMHNIDKPVPFKIVEEDNKNGQAKIVLSEGRQLDFEKRKHFKFFVRAFDCGSPPLNSEKVRVIIHVVDVNESPPVFEQVAYSGTVNEGVLNQKVVQVKATDKDGSPVFHEICKYEIVTPDVPFKIDHRGIIRNTEKLIWKKQMNYFLKVSAVDCGHKKSKTHIVSIQVKKVCRPAWQGIEKRVEYETGTMLQLLYPNARFDMCDKNCTQEKVTARVSLKTKHIGKGCDRDTYSEKSKRKLCGGAGKAVDLLPSPSAKNSWTKKKKVPTATLR